MHFSGSQTYGTALQNRSVLFIVTSDMDIRGNVRAHLRHCLLREGVGFIAVITGNAADPYLPGRGTTTSPMTSRGDKLCVHDARHLPGAWDLTTPSSE